MNGTTVVLTKDQLAVLEAIVRGEELAGNGKDLAVASKELRAKRLVSMAPPGVLPLWAPTSLGRLVLRLSVERAES